MTNLELATAAYEHAKANYNAKDARYDVIVECFGIDEIAEAFRNYKITTMAGAREWARETARGQHEQELNQAWDGPESCIGSSKYDPAFDPRNG